MADMSIMMMEMMNGMIMMLIQMFISFMPLILFGVLGYIAYKKIIK